MYAVDPEIGWRRKFENRLHICTYIYTHTHLHTKKGRYLGTYIYIYVMCCMIRYSNKHVYIGKHAYMREGITFVVWCTHSFFEDLVYAYGPDCNSTKVPGRFL